MANSFRERAAELVSRMTLSEKMGQMKFKSPAIERLGVPAYCWWNEALHGYARSGTATVYPQAIAMAASFDEGLLHTVADEISDEARAKYNEYKKQGYTDIYQGITLWSPNINIFRDPRWGRGHETYGEDPYLTGVMGSAFVSGIQGEGRYRKADATLKHFAVHSGPEGERHGFNSEVGEYDLYETYLRAFAYCIEHAHPSAVMGAYNRVNGEVCCGSEWLLGEVLRGRLGFDGYVVSDCGAVNDFHAGHHVTSTAAESAAMAVNAGCDLNCGMVYEQLQVSYDEGLLSEETITESVTRLFEARFRLGMFDDDCEYDRIPYSVVGCDKHEETNLRMAREGIVLLKNNGILPLRKDTNVAVIGPNADSRTVLLGNYNGTPSRCRTLLEGIQEVCTGTVQYAVGSHNYLDTRSIPNAEHYLPEARIIAEKSDVVILCMGLTPQMEGEEGDAYNAEACGDRVTIELPACQRLLYNEVRKMGKPVVFVNVSGSCVALSAQDEESDAVVQVFYPGALGGRALADVLFGNVSPSGRLPVTFYRSDGDLPPFRDYSMKNRTYRYFTGKPVYPFGYGLTYADIRENWTDDLTVTVENRGGFDTGYTVLRYENRPEKTLCGIRRVFLRQGESVTVRF